MFNYFKLFRVLSDLNIYFLGFIQILASSCGLVLYFFISIVTLAISGPSMLDFFSIHVWCDVIRFFRILVHFYGILLQVIGIFRFGMLAMILCALISHLNRFIFQRINHTLVEIGWNFGFIHAEWRQFYSIPI